MNFPQTSLRPSLWVMAAAMIFILSGCRNDEPGQSAITNNDPYLTFTIVISSDRSTRAGEVNDSPWGENDMQETGNSFESRINSILPVLYQVDDNNRLITSAPVGVMKDAEYTRVQGSENLVITGKLETSYSASQLSQGNFRLAVFVNSQVPDISEPEKVIFTHDGQADKNGFNAIPMFGIGSASFEGLPESIHDVSKESPFMIKGGQGNNDELIIPLLRSMAQVRVKVSEQLFRERKMKLTGLTISRHYLTGYTVPSDWQTTSSMALLGMESCFYPFAPLSPLTKEEVYVENCKATPIENDESYENDSPTMLRLYVPETPNYQNDSLLSSFFNFGNDEEAGAKDITLTVSYTADDREDVEKRNKILFRTYKKGQPDLNSDARNIIRNHIYEFVITGIAPDTDRLIVTVDTQWWGEHKLDLE